MSQKMIYDHSKSALYTPHLQGTVFTRAVPTVSAWVCAELSRLAYVPFEDGPAHRQRLAQDVAIAGFDLTHTIKVGDIAAITLLHRSTQTTVLAFRGTVPNWSNIKTDLAGWQATWEYEGMVLGGNVHAGFKQAWASIWPSIVAAIGAQLPKAIITGHSLGAALATLAASAVLWRAPAAQVKLRTIGCPGTGDADFARTLAQLPNERYVHCCDIVTRIEPVFVYYEQLGPMRYIDREGVLLAEVPPPEGLVSKDRRVAQLEYAAAHAWKWDSVLLRDLADHAAINYVRALMLAEGVAD